MRAGGARRWQLGARGPGASGAGNRELWEESRWTEERERAEGAGSLRTWEARAPGELKAGVEAAQGGGDEARRPVRECLLKGREEKAPWEATSAMDQGGPHGMP